MNRFPYSSEEIRIHQARLDQNQNQPQAIIENYEFPVVIGQNGAIYQVRYQIGEGTFGTVHAGNRIPNSIQVSEVVIKFIDTSRPIATYKMYQDELETLQKVKQSNLQGLQKLVDYGKVDVSKICRLYGKDTYFLILQREGMTLENIFSKNNQLLKKSEILKLGIQLMKSIRQLHSIGYVHLDIKTDNIMFNNKVSEIKLTHQINAQSFEKQEQREEEKRLVKYNHKYPKLQHSDLTLIDLGNCQQYRTSEGHRPNIYLQEITNRNCFWASKHYFSKNVLSRRDDIIQIVYNMLFLTGPSQKMQQVYFDSVPNQIEAMRSFKLNSTPEEVCDSATFLIPLLKEAYSYDFSDEPQYGKLIFMMEHALIKMNCVPDRYFSWFNEEFWGRAIKTRNFPSAEIEEKQFDEYSSQQDQGDFIIQPMPIPRPRTTLSALLQQ